MFLISLYIFFYIICSYIYIVIFEIWIKLKSVLC